MPPSALELVDLLQRAGLCGRDEAPHAEPLPGGVSSDIWRVELASGPVCVKRALPRLRVAELWEAPVERNRYEYEWFRVAGAAAPEAVPKMLARADGAFVMEYLEPARYPVWKALLATGQAEASFAAAVGSALARIHGGTTGVGTLFPTDAIFHAIRLEPYLLAAAARHPRLAGPLQALAHRTMQTRLCLVHGDVSPKNILAGPRGPVFLDAECAWYGDPAFDLAFCLNHLLLKCLWVPGARDGFLRCFERLAAAYLAQAPFPGVEGRAASLLPGLLLARIDGKSPVEYLGGEAQAHVRRFAGRFIEKPVSELDALAHAWRESLT